jgi:molybdopterin-binding protein
LNSHGRGPFRDRCTEALMALSARNHLVGTIDEIKWGDVLVHVTVRVGDHMIESVITRRSAEEMELKEGDTVTAVVKATEVMLSKG